MQFHSAHSILPSHTGGTLILETHLSAPSWRVWSNLLSVYKTEKSEKVVELFFIQEFKMFEVILQNRNKSCGGIVEVEYLVTLWAVKGIGSKMHSLNVLGHSLLCGKSLWKYKKR